MQSSFEEEELPERQPYAPGGRGLPLVGDTFGVSGRSGGT